MDHYEASLGWQQLFIVAGVGVAFVCLGIGFQLLQVIVSFVQRKANLDTTGDPWNGRTLEWSTASPAPEYNFAVLPEANERDPFWAAKQQKSATSSTKPTYHAIRLPKNSGLGIVIAGFAFVFGFAVVWHILWLGVLGLAGLIVTIIVRSLDDHTEKIISAATIAEIEASRKGRYA
jgi:cytochrome o ubiquinol oxidase subunit 1